MQRSAERSCRVSYGLGEGGKCRNLLHSLSIESSKTNSSRISVDLPVFPMKSEITFCFIVKASDSKYTAEAERMLTLNSGTYE